MIALHLQKTKQFFSETVEIKLGCEKDDFEK